MKKLLVFFLLALSFKTHAQDQFIWNSKIEQIYELITSLRIPEAKKLIVSEKKTNPNNLSTLLLESYADLYQLFFTENQSEYAQFLEQTEKRIDRVKASTKQSPFYRYALGTFYLHKSVGAIRFDNTLEAALTFRKAYHYFKENGTVYPKFGPNNLYLGILTSVLGTIPNNYQWVLNILGMGGSIAEGNGMVLKYINDRSAHAKVCRNEALLIYPYLLTNFEGNNKKALEFLQSPVYDFKNNHLHAFMAMNLHLNNQQAAKALVIAKGITRSEQYLDNPFWHYEKGYAYLNQLQLNEASEEFKIFIQEFKGNFYVKDAYDKLSLVAYLQNDMKKAAEYRAKVLSQGNQVTDADMSAQQQAKKQTWPNPILLKARLLSDGGLQAQALKLLTNLPSGYFKTELERTEYVYRLGRIHDLMGEKDEALRHYLSAIDKGKHLKAYFASRAALQAGMIYEERKDWKNAARYFTICLEMKDHDFKNSLDQKAKSGLRRCKGKGPVA